MKLALVCLLGAAIAHAQAPAKTVFVTPAQLDAASILSTPPANDSWQTLADLAELHRLEQTRTPQQVAHAQADENEESMFLFADLLGPKFNRAALPLTALLSDHVKNNESVIVNPAKVFFKRPRPYNLDATLHPVCKIKEDPADYSYPSGHGTTGFLEALVLARILPKKRDAILARAADYANSREVCGVRYRATRSRAGRSPTP